MIESLREHSLVLSGTRSRKLAERGGHHALEETILMVHDAMESNSDGSLDR